MTPHPYTLAAPGYADCADPDTPDSPGALFLIRCLKAAAEHVSDGYLSAYPEDDAAELADAAVPTYTHTLWATFVDLAAWREDVTEYGPITMEQGARIALYEIARRLISAVLAGTDADTDTED